LVPVMVTVTTWLLEPSRLVTVKLSVMVSRAPSSWIAVWLLSAV
jgi:hypothetical protein